MSHTVTVHFGTQTLLETSDEEELREELRKIYEEFTPPSPFITISHSNENYLVCGISEQCCFIIYHPSDMSKSCYVSVGNRSLPKRKEPVYIFNMADRLTEMYARSCISFEHFLEVVVHFLKTGKRPIAVIDWEVD